MLSRGIKSRKRGSFGRQARPRVITTKTITTGGRVGLPLGPPRTGGFYGVGVRRRMNEKKTIDIDSTSSNITSTAAVTLISGVATGTDFTDRIGRKIILNSLYVRAYLRPEDDGCANNTVRLAIVYDMQTNGAAPAYTDIFKQATTTAQLNLNNRDRFKILYDKLFALGAVQTTATQAFSNGHNQFSFKKYIKLRHEMIFSGTTAAVGSIQTGAMWIVWLGENAAGNGATLGWTSRIRFSDA